MNISNYVLVLLCLAKVKNSIYSEEQMLDILELEKQIEQHTICIRRLTRQLIYINNLNNETKHKTQKPKIKIRKN